MAVSLPAAVCDGALWRHLAQTGEVFLLRSLAPSLFVTNTPRDSAFADTEITEPQSLDELPPLKEPLP